MRCFVGIPLECSVRDAFVDAGAAVRAADPSWSGEKWVAAENLHITVAFLGEVEASDAAAIAERLGQALGPVRALSLPFVGVTAVPNPRRATMLWGSYSDPDARAADLASRVALACAECGVTLQDRPFRAHVTLARTRKPRRVGEAALAALASSSETVPAFVSVRGVTLFSSTLTKAGPRYESLEAWTFPT